MRRILMGFVTLLIVLGCAASSAYAGNLTKVTQVIPSTIGPGSACAVAVDGHVDCWGHNADGQTDVPSSASPATQVAGVSPAAWCAIKQADGALSCWGPVHLYAAVSAQLGAVSSLASSIGVGGGSFCAIRQADSSVGCWQVGSTNLSGDTPADLGPVSQVAVGQGDSGGRPYYCAIKQPDQSMRCWGAGANAGEQADIPADLGAVSSMALGARNTCAIKKSNGAVRCWGANNLYGQLAPPPDLGAASQITSNGSSLCAIRKADGAALCWGYTSGGTMNPPADLGPVSQIAMGLYEACAVKVDGDPVCWGGDPDISVGLAPGWIVGNSLDRAAPSTSDDVPASLNRPGFVGGGGY